MKHIISLSLKYIRRQKSRTFLTFLCIVLSVFILCSFGAYMGSILQTLRNSSIRQVGSYEADISTWLNHADDTDTAIDIVQNHVAVSDYYLSKSVEANSMTDETDNGQVKYFELSAGSNSKKITRIYAVSSYGNPKIYGERMGMNETSKNTDGVTVPGYFKDMGYSVGDTVTFSLCPVAGEIDEDSQQVKEVRQKLSEEYGSPLTRSDPEYNELESGERSKVYTGTLWTALSVYGNLDETELKNKEYGEKVDITIKIADFNENYSYSFLSMIEYGNNGNYFGELFEKNPEYSANEMASGAVRINDNIDFDDGMIMLYGDLGYNTGNYYGDLPNLNTELLFFELKSAAGLVEMIPAIILLFVLIFFAWLVARFVIDNAFEISNQERSSQYAALRIMGASKSQIAALVFTEAVFYTVTAIPIGTAAAYLLCSSSINALKKIGFQDFEFKANIYFVIGGIILCISAIFISAYTSAMWASRKLSPAEALNFGKPHSKKKKIRKRKSKINLSSGQFLRRYTNKNIMRSKGRYIISTITMTFGVMFFTFSLMSGMFFYTEIEELFEDGGNNDFIIQCQSVEDYGDAERTFYNNELFSETEIYANSGAQLKKSGDMDKIKELCPYDVDLEKYIGFYSCDSYYYNENFAELTGMTYDEFKQSGGAILLIPSYGSYENYVYDENGSPVPQYEESYQQFETPLNLDYHSSRKKDDSGINIIGIVCTSLSNNTNIIMPIDSPLTENFDFWLNIYLWVNGQENYIEAEKLCSDFAENHVIWEYDNKYAIATGLNEFVKAIIKIAVSFILSIWLVGILSMINSINTSVLNRSRELMMLRSVGMSRKQLRQTVFLESVMFSAVSSGLGTITAVGAFFVVMIIAGFTPVMLVSMAVGLILSIAVNIIIAGLAALPAVRSLEMAESLVKNL